MKKRIFSMLLVLVMVFTMFPTSAIAVGSGTEQDSYQVGDTVTNDGTAEPEGVKAENTHWERTDVPASQTTVCQTEEHDHVSAGCTAAYEAVQCLLEDHPEGETAFTHEDGTECAYDAESAMWLTNVEAGFTCGIEAHTHTVEGGCITEVPGYTLWTLVEDEQTPPPANNALTTLELEPLAEDDDKALPIHFFLASPGNINRPTGNYTNYYVPLNDSQNEAWTIANIKGDESWSTIYTQNGIRNVTDESIVTRYVASWPGNDRDAFEKFGSVRIGTTTYYDTDYEIKWVSIMCRDNDHRDWEMHCNQSYDGEHIHIDGLLVQKIQPGEMEVYKSIPSAVATDTTFHFTLQKLEQPDLTSPPASADAIDESFEPMILTATISAGQTEAQISGGDDITFGYYKLTENDSANWENAGVAMTDSNNRTRTDNNARALYIRIAPNGTVQYSTSVSSSYTTMKKVSVLNARKDVTVTYQWKIYDASGDDYREEVLGELGAHGVPASVSVQPGAYYTYNTGYHEGTSYHDYANGLLYTFHGWDTYSNRSAFGVDPTISGYTALDDGDTNAANNKKIPIDADTWINGYWSVSKLDPVDAYIMVHKDLEVDGDREYVDSYLRNTGKMFIRIDPGIDKDGDGKAQIDVDYPGAVTEDGIKVGVYQYAVPFEFTEMQADVPGYELLNVEVKVTGDHATLLSDKEGDYDAAVELNEVYSENDDEVHLGTVTYINTYKKNVGDPVTEYPTLTLVKRATDTGDLQADAEFTLYSDKECTEPVLTVVTDEDGTATIDFGTIQTKSDTYYLKETAAPDGYLVDETVYTLNLTSSEEEELRNNEFVMVTTYALNITVPADSSAEPVQNAADELKYSLNVLNDPILGQLKVTKSAIGLDDEAKALLEASVTVHGPITRNARGQITGLGSEYTLILNNENEWTDIQEELPIGEYLIHENTATVHGYTWDMKNVAYGELETEVYNNITSGVFDIAADSTDIELTITNTYREWEAAGFEIHKVDPIGANLGGATFQLYSDEACTIKVTDPTITTNAVTGANGRAWFDGFTVPAGQTVATYYLQETIAPAGHYLSDTIYKVEIKPVDSNTGTTYEPKISVKLNGNWGEAEGFSNTSDILTVVNTPVKGQLKITKNMVNAPTDDEYGVKSVTLYVSGPGYGQTVTLTPDDSGKWEKTLHNLPLGTYTITEQNAEAAGYDLVTTYTVDGQTTTDKATVVLKETTPGKTKEGDIFAGAATVTNTYTKRVTTIENPTYLIVKKVGENGSTGLAGAEFTLVRERDGHTVTYTTNAEGIVKFDFLTGTVNNGAVAKGKYTLSETKAPAGYAKTDKTWTVTVKDVDGEPRIVLDVDRNIWQNIWDWIIGNVKDDQNSYAIQDNTLILRNEELADLTIHKDFVGATPDNDAVIEVAVFNSQNQLVQQVELTNANKWTVQLENIPADTYTVRETSPSLHGYTWQSAEFTVTGVSENDVTEKKASSVKVAIENSEEVYVTIENTYTEWEAVDFYVLKTDAEGNPLPDATFKLYDENDTEVTNKVHIDTEIHTNNGNTTGSGGILHFHDFEVPAGDEDGIVIYYLEEYKEPDNYYENTNRYKIVINCINNAYDITITREDDSELTVAADKAVFNHANDVLTVVNEEILADLTIKKTFEGGLKPNSVMVKVTGPEGYENTVVLANRDNDPDDYEITLTDLPLGKYTVKELDAAHDGYALTVKYDGQIEEEGTVTLTEENDDTPAVANIHNIYHLDKHNPASFTVLKVDADDQTKKLEGAKFGLYDSNGRLVGEEKTTGNDGTVTFGPFDETAVYTLKEIAAPVHYEKTDATWTVTVTDEDGKPRVVVDQNTGLNDNIWDWIVDIITGQTGATWDKDENTLTVPNTIKTGDLVITKAVEILDDHKGYADGKTYEIKLDCSDDKFDQIIKLKDGESKTIKGIPYGTTYTVTEDTTDAAFTYEIRKHDTDSVINTEITSVEVINKYEIVEKNPGLNLLKVDADTAKPIEGVTFEVYYDEDCTNYMNSGTTDANGKVNIPFHYYGYETYYLKEVAPAEGYYPNENVYKVKAQTKYVVHNPGKTNAYVEKQQILTVEGLGNPTVDATNEISYTYTVTNIAIKPVTITATKTWNDGGYYARPDEVTVTLYRDGNEYDSKTLNEANGWTYTWSGDDFTDEYDWTVDEKVENVPAEYVKSVTNEGNDWTITNTRTPNAVEITVTKAWKHNGGKNLPESIQVTLYADGKAKETVTLNEANQWTYTWTGLTDVSKWSVDEVEVPEGYTKTIKVDGYKFEITNTRTVNPVEVSVTKEWVASEGVILPESIEVVLYRDGKEFKTVKLSADNEWTYKWTDLTDEYTWSVDEKTVPDGYTKNVTNEGNDFTITNTKIFKNIDVSVEKIWYSPNVNHPASIEVTLYRDGVAFDAVKLNADNGWKYVWKDLTDEFVWTVDEPSVPSGYTKEVKDLGGNAFLITNTHEDIPKTGDFTNFGGLVMMGIAGVFGFLATAFFLLVPRKKGKYER